MGYSTHNRRYSKNNKLDLVTSFNPNNLNNLDLNSIDASDNMLTSP